MRIIAVEEHFNTDELLAPSGRVIPPAIRERLVEIGERRLGEMDEAGVDMMVLSPSAPAVQMLEPKLARELSVATNDHLAEAVAAHPDRFAGLATLPTSDPPAAVLELERAVTELGFKGAMIHGHTLGRFLDEPDFWPILECAESLGVPLYLHPAPLPAAVVAAYYSGLDPDVARALSMAAWGWHVETGLHALRLVVAGVFDRFPALQFILGHMGENLPFSLARADSILSRAVKGLEHPVAHYFHENFHITMSGYFTLSPFQCALSVFGADRMMFSIDFPHSSNVEAVRFLETVPVGPREREKIAHENAERLLRL